MKESIGAGWIMVIVLTFITLFSAYLAFSINYSKAFSLKDTIVDKIEKHSGFKKVTKDDVYEYMESISYASKGVCNPIEDEFKVPKIIGVIANNYPDSNPRDDKFNYCIEKHNSKNYVDGIMSYSYYTVTAFFTLDIPIINQMSTFSVNGETTDIYFATDEPGYF